MRQVLFSAEILLNSEILSKGGFFFQTSLLMNFNSRVGYDQIIRIVLERVTSNFDFRNGRRQSTTWF